MNDTIDSIIRFELCPLQETNQGNDYYEPLFRQLGIVEENFDASYNIKFEAPEFSSKVKYYKRLIDNAITKYLNGVLSDENKKDIVLYKRKKLRDLVSSYLTDIKDIIVKNNLDLDIIITVRDYSKALHLNECTYIFHYLILSLIRCYMEFQQYYIEMIESDKQLTVDDFFVQMLQWRKTENIGIVPIQKIEIQPIQEVSKHKAKTDAAVLSFTYTKLESESDNINTLFSELKKHEAIPTDFPITEFKHLFSGVKVANPIQWIGNKSDLAYLFKLLVNEKKVLNLPPQATIWDIVDACFVNKDGKHFGKDILRKQQTPKRTAQEIEHFAYLMT